MANDTKKGLNTNSNTYTIVYSAVMVIIVAFLLAFDKRHKDLDKFLKFKETAMRDEPTDFGVDGVGLKTQRKDSVVPSVMPPSRPPLCKLAIEPGCETPSKPLP